MGSAMVSHDHANFIINIGGAMAMEVIALATMVRQRVHAAYGVKLEYEIKIWDDPPGASREISRAA